MSFGVFRKLLSCLGISAFLWLAMPAVAWAQQSCGSCAAQFGIPCAVGHCPPPFKYTYEGPPCILFHCGCPRPIANPCQLPHWGFYETCWNPWPFPPDWTHCPAPPPPAFVNLNPGINQALPPIVPRNSFGSPQSGATPPPMPMPMPTMQPPGNGNNVDQLNMPRRYENNSFRP